MSENLCSNCGVVLSGEAGFGMVMCQNCGQLVMSGEKPPIPAVEEGPEIFNDVVDFGNTTVPSTASGALVYEVRIEGVDTVELRQDMVELLDDPRLGFGAELHSQVKNGVLILKSLNPVKASVIVNRIKHLPFKISWSSQQLIKSLVFLIGLFSVGSARASEWAQHEISLKSYALRITSAQEDLKALILKKDKNSDPSTRDKLLDAIKKKNDEIQRLYQNFREEREHVIYEHPEQGDNTERKYRHVKLKTMEELENEAGIDGKLSRLKTKVEQTYPKAVPTAAPKD